MDKITVEIENLLYQNWLGFSADTSEAEARSYFFRRMQRQPEYVVLEREVLFAGPLEKVVKNEIMVVQATLF